ncbi:MAG: type VI secretion system baseplate subunit TssF [Planctomycetaceae bacterium]|nr:MAG: type VI secretion system baseplate subunit TssF [Planctomycetaceae bacterium]
MDARMLHYYNRELQVIRELGAEFAKQYPKVAGRLSLDEFECVDPYVERLLEGFAFLTARVRIKLDAEHAELTQHLLDVVYPNYLAPLPSMVVARMTPDMRQSSLLEGQLVPRQTVLRGRMGKGDQTACEYRTAHEVVLWPLELADAGYFSRSAAAIDLPSQVRNVKATIRLTLSTGGIPLRKLDMDELPIWICGNEQLPMSLYEQLLADTRAIVVRPVGTTGSRQTVLPAGNLTADGFAGADALLPQASQSFQGYRLVQEYFAFPQRFMFVRLKGLRQALADSDATRFEIIFTLDRATEGLDGRVSQANFALFCTPAINLFPKITDRVFLNDQDVEHHVIPDRTRPLDYEVHSVRRVTGYGADDRSGQTFFPFFAAYDAIEDEGGAAAYFTTSRQVRRLSDREKRMGARSSYLGSEVFLSLVDAKQAPYRGALRQLRIETLCTNRDLALQMPLGLGDTDFSLGIGAPVERVRCVAGPTTPLPSRAHESGTLLWRLVGSLTLNYLSLTDLSDGRGAMAIRDLLALFVAENDVVMRRQIDGLTSIRSRRVVRRIPGDGPITFGRGLEIGVTMDESAFDGSGPFLLASVLKEFFAKYVSINSFAETALYGSNRGEIKRWPAIIGKRALL